MSIQQDRYIPPEDNVQYLLTAEFDNKYGPTLKRQHPKQISGFDCISEAGQNCKNAFNLASLMIPNNVEYNTSGEADSTIFILYRNTDTQSYQLFPVSRSDEMSAENPDTLFFLSFVKAKKETSNMRGTKIKSIALGTPIKSFNMFRPVLMSALDSLMSAETYEETSVVLRHCFNLMNSLDLSYIKKIHANYPLQDLISAIDDTEALKSLFDDTSDSARIYLKLLELEPHDKYGNTIRLKNGNICIDYDAYKPAEDIAALKERPFLVSISHPVPIDVTIRYNLRLSNFLKQFVSLLYSLNSETYSFKIIINSNKLSKNVISQFVLALSNFMSCFYSDKIQYYKNGPVIVFPYMEVSMMDAVRKYFESCTSPHLFVIIGTANPIFKVQEDLWNYYYDLDNNILYQPNDERNEPKSMRWDSVSIKKMLLKSTTTAPKRLETPRMGLMEKFLEAIVEETPRNTTVLNVLKRVNILQLIDLDTFKKSSEHADRTLLDEYIISYKDLVVFPEFFKRPALVSIRHLATLNEVMISLYRSQEDPSERLESLNELCDILDKINSFVSLEKSNLEWFMSICSKFPFFQLSLDGDLRKKDFTTIDLKKEWNENFRSTNSWMYMVNNRDINTVIDTFSEDRSLNLLCLPLLLSPNVKGKAYIPPSTPNKPTMEVEPKQPRSATIKWMLNLGTSKLKETALENLSIKSTSELSSVSSTPTSKNLPPSALSVTNTSSLSSKVDYELMQNRTRDIKKLTLELLQTIECHPIGKIFIDKSMHPFFQKVLECSILEYANEPKKQESPVKNIEIISAEITSVTSSSDNKNISTTEVDKHEINNS